MRVLVIPRDFPSAEEPQAGIFVLRQVQALQAMGHELRVVRIVPHAPPLFAKWRAYGRVPESYSIEGVAVRTLRAIVPPRMFGIGMVRAQVSGALAREAVAFNADIAHIHCVLPTGALAVNLGISTVLTAHGSDTYREPWRRADLRAEARVAVAHPSEVAAVSAFIKDAVGALGRPDAAIVYNGADERVFAPRSRSAARAALGIDPNRRVVAYAGNLLAAKGIFDLVEALASLDEPRPLVLIAGGGPEASRLSARMEEARIECRMLGRLPQPALSAVLGAADVFAFPSHAEGLPGAVCEAMLAGRAVVATRVGGVPEIVKAGETGLLVPKNSPRELARALRTMMDDASLRARFEQNSRTFALRWLTWRVNASAYDKLYQRALNANQRKLHRSA